MMNTVEEARIGCWRVPAVASNSPLHDVEWLYALLFLGYLGVAAGMD